VEEDLPNKMKKIQLTQGKTTIVDNEDYDKLNQHSWYARYDQKHDCWYAARQVHIEGRQKTILMHWEIMSTPVGMDTDHRNHDGLDNQKLNLRVCTHSQNGQNRRMRFDNTSGVTGVVWHKRLKKWAARIKIDGIQKHLGYYIDLNEAIKARRDAEENYFGEFKYSTA
jgi:hypothetical protein